LILAIGSDRRISACRYLNTTVDRRRETGIATRYF
jgi:hypothetical protein